MCVCIFRVIFKNDPKCSSPLLRFQPRYNHAYTVRGSLAMAVAICFFARGLDDSTDPYRLFHGLWHTFCGISAYFFWMALPGPQGTPDAYPGVPYGDATGKGGAV